MKRVSTGLVFWPVEAEPGSAWTENSFHKRVPTGNSQASGRDPSIAVPGGK